MTTAAERAKAEEKAREDARAKEQAQTTLAKQTEADKLQETDPEREAAVAAAKDSATDPVPSAPADATGNAALTRAEADAATSNIYTPSVPNPSGDGFVDPETLPVAQRRIIPQAVAFQPADGVPNAAADDEATRKPDPDEVELVNVVVLQRCYDGAGRTLEPGDRTMYPLRKGDKLPSVFEPADRPSAQGE